MKRFDRWVRFKPPIATDPGQIQAAVDNQARDRRQSLRDVHLAHVRTLKDFALLRLATSWYKIEVGGIVDDRVW
jgi:hypothetical protein